MIKYFVSIFISIVFIVILIISYVIFYTSIINSQTVAVTSIDMSNSKIELKGSLTSSGVFYRKYEASYSDNTLYITLRGSLIKLPNNNGEFDISIPNTYGDIKRVYLKDNSPQGNTLIWPK